MPIAIALGLVGFGSFALFNLETAVGRARVRSALTQSVKNFKAKKLNVHGHFLLKTSGQLPFLGSTACHPP